MYGRWRHQNRQFTSAATTFVGRGNHGSREFWFDLQCGAAGCRPAEWHRYHSGVLRPHREKSSVPVFGASLSEHRGWSDCVERYGMLANHNCLRNWKFRLPGHLGCDSASDGDCCGRIFQHQQPGGGERRSDSGVVSCSRHCRCCCCRCCYPHCWCCRCRCRSTYW